MATVTGLTAERMLEIEAACIVGGAVTLDNLILTRHDGATVNAGSVRGPQGIQGVPGIQGVQGVQGVKGDSSLPAGTINLWSGDTAPANWLICDGAAVSRTTYASLFSAIGTKYGIGDGSTTFNLPNLKGRTPVGKDAAQTEFSALGKTGGEKAHILTTAEMPSHTHTQNAHTHTLNNGTVASDTHYHGLSSVGYADIAVAAATTNQIVMRRITSASWTATHSISNTNLGNGAAVYTSASTSAAELGGRTNNNTDTTTVSANNTTATNNSTGSGDAHNVLQPYSVVNFIIKTTNGDTAEDSQLTQRVSALEATSVPASFELRDKMEDLKFLITGGGIRKVASGSVSWGQRFITIGAGVDSYAPQGYFSIDMPPDGTVIPVHGSTSISSVTVAGGVIPTGSLWSALYYELPIGQPSASVPGRFHWVDFGTAMPFAIPPHWVLIVVRNNDSRSATYKWGDGRSQDYWHSMVLINGWVDYGGSYAASSWIITDNGQFETKGLIKGGSTGSANPFCTLSVDWAPEAIELFTVTAAGGAARIDVNSNGNMSIYEYIAGGTNAYVSLSGLRWFPKGT